MNKADLIAKKGPGKYRQQRTIISKDNDRNKIKFLSVLNGPKVEQWRRPRFVDQSLFSQRPWPSK